MPFIAKATSHKAQATLLAAPVGCKLSSFSRGNEINGPKASRCLASAGDHAVPEQLLQSPAAVVGYVSKQPLLKRYLGITAENDEINGGSAESGSERKGEVNVQELSGGRINFVWGVSGPQGGFVLKYAAPFVRSIGPEFKLSQTRLGVEAEAMAAAHTACPQHVPKLLLYDATANVLVQELVSGPGGSRRVKLVDALTPCRSAGAGRGSRGGADGCHGAATTAASLPPLPPSLAADLASLLSAYMLRNSMYGLPYEQHAIMSERLRNGEVVAANAAVVFTDPWDATCDRNRVPPALTDEVAQLR
ncbi:hypothetical protein VOLCADRAFT_92361 [Volvox carteri f. nagariensis]|uniref:Aminoglycoside phosphotransferase domain-containing protein n=1 Tax=Volvox carteri f. nagariensis TaxID=3068 RepID=D8TZG6_VOLCA|nr:uncharacterized protein VOLCADRAFT_92361 [Volvox carteri f. nagariensis]EFJ47270.1 hypothetical protein VOLCADRAFT_92361 [Volvox carteri f. nagariensis]|eukprot:XP_002951819.1 hypothetical protein VOLCADRAFT_92361 [Volvox carteri f. nagariensis]